MQVAAGRDLDDSRHANRTNVATEIFAAAAKVWHPENPWRPLEWAAWVKLGPAGDKHPVFCLSSNGGSEPVSTREDQGASTGRGSMSRNSQRKRAREDPDAVSVDGNISLLGSEDPNSSMSGLQLQQLTEVTRMQIQGQVQETKVSAFRIVQEARAQRISELQMLLDLYVDNPEKLRACKNSLIALLESTPPTWNPDE
jgi:hypothetical protein